MVVEPTFDTEQTLLANGARSVAGVDEAGRGPLAGPVVAAAVAVHGDLPQHVRDLVVRDSKQMTALQRDRAFVALVGTYGVAHGVGLAQHHEIDDVGIVPATKRAMQRALSELPVAPGHLLLDGRFVLDDINIPQRAAPRSDQTIWVCAAASVIAKVVRDRIMQEHHASYPLYGFNQHKGYGTAAHRSAIAKHGPCPIHRRSFTLPGRT